MKYKRAPYKELIWVMDRFFRYKIDHVVFWALTIFFHGYTRLWLLQKADTFQFLFEIIFRNALLAGVIYLNLLVVLPRFIHAKKYVTGISLILITLVTYVLLKSIHDGYLYSVALNLPGKGTETHLFYNLSIVTFYFIFATALHLSKEWYLQRELIRRIEFEKINTELEYLKAQMNPHFLFNSLNTVYFQIDKQNSVARETLTKFSDMLRYQLYECNGHEISVEKEISYLKNYVELQRLRRDENYSIEFSSSEEMKDFTLPPLLLVPFVENAFKHISTFVDRKNVIKIDVSKTGNFFRFSVRNTKDNIQHPSKNGGIGLKNVKRRLELLYRDKYLLDIQDTPEYFSVNLELHVV